MSEALIKRITELAAQAAREGAPSLLHHADRSQTGEATLTVKLAIKRTGHLTDIAPTAWKATHTDSDGDALPAEILDDRQGALEIK